MNRDVSPGRGYLRRSPLWGGLIAAVVASAAAHATTLMRPADLSELVDESRRAALVEVVEVGYAYDEHQVPSTYLTLRVDDAIYGAALPSAGETFRVKLFGAPAEMPDGLRLHLDGTPAYGVGQRYLLLLNGESDWGFSNTVGLMFGAFLIEAGPAGIAQARSLGGNRHAFGEQGLGTWLGRDVSAAELRSVADPAAAVPYDLLRQALSELWQAQGGTPLPRPTAETLP